MKLKVLKGMGTELCGMRELRNRYETNRGFKAAALFYYLKQLSTSGRIHGTDWLHYTCKDLHISKATAYNYRQYAKDLGLMTVHKNGDIVLTSYDTLCEKYTLNKEFITLELDKKHKLEDCLKALEYQEAWERMEKGLNAKVRNNPHVKAAFGMEATQLGVKEEVIFSNTDLGALQSYLFAAGGSGTTYDALFIPNPDLNRSLITMAKVRKMKSIQSASYERSRLANLGILNVTPQAPVLCHYRILTKDGKVKGRLQHRRRIYDAKTNTAKWYRPHAVELNPAAIATTQNPRPAPYV